MATLYLRNGKYYLNYNVNGRRVRKSVGTDRREAELYLKEIRYRLSTGDIRPARPRVPIDLLIKRYLQFSRTRIAPSTLVRYKNALRHFSEYIVRHSPVQFVDQITKIMLSGYIDFRINQSKKPKSNTINQELTIIRAMLNFAVDSEYIDRNPASRIKMLKTNDAKKGQVISEAEIELLMKGCDRMKHGPWFRDILTVFLHTGMRLGELLNLTWEDIDWEQELIKIQDKPFWSPKTYARDIPINPTVKRVLERFKLAHRGIHVFTWKGGQIEANKLRKQLISLSRRVGLHHISRIHDFRHTFASNLLMKGVDIPTVQALLGHRSWNTTLIYSHQTREHVKQAVQRIG